MLDDHPMLSARIVSLADLFADGPYEPALVQREYRWRRHERAALLDDLVAAFSATELDVPAPDTAPAPEPAPAGEEEDADAPPAVTAPIGKAPTTAASAPIYYAGPIVLHAEGARTLIYDGLQRFTTLTILLAVLRDLAETDDARAMAEAAIGREGAFTLRHDSRDQTLLFDVQRAGATRSFYEPDDGVAEGGRRIRGAVIGFRDRLRDWSDARRAGFVRFILERLRFTAMYVEDARLAYQVFVTTNARGLPLTGGELLKSQIVNVMGEAAPERAADAAAAWVQTQRRFEDPDFEDLLRAADFMERMEAQLPDFTGRLFAWLAAAGPDAPERFVLERLPQLADLHARLLDHRGQDKVSDPLNRAARRLSLLPWAEWRPIALALLARGGRASRLAGWMERLSAAAFAMAIHGFSADDRAVIARRALTQLRTKGFTPGQLFSAGALSFPERQRLRIRQNLEQPVRDHETRIWLVRWLASLRDETIPDWTIGYDLTVEHIAPRRLPPGSAWKAFQHAGVHEATVDLIGNLALLPKREGEDLGNRGFGVKRKIYALYAEHHPLLADVAAAEDWTPEAVRARTERLAGLALAHLGFEG